MNKILLVLLCLFSSSLTCLTKAEEPEDKDFSHHSVALTGGTTFYDDTWKVELSYRYSPFKNSGFRWYIDA